MAELGAKKSSHLRLTLSQAFNSLGTTIGPWLGSHVLLTGGVFAAGAVVTVATRGQSMRSIDFAFLALGGFFALVAAFIFSARKQINAAAPATDPSGSNFLTAFRSPWAVFGAAAIFIYVGSEVAIGSLMTNFLASESILNRPLEEAGKLVAFYWGGAMVGRFVGTALLRFIPAGWLLALCTVAAGLLCFVVTQTGGTTAAYAALSIGLFNSVMFPTIFTLTLERSSAPTSATSGLLVFGIIGGAVAAAAGRAYRRRLGRRAEPGLHRAPAGLCRPDRLRDRCGPDKGARRGHSDGERRALNSPPPAGEGLRLAERSDASSRKGEGLALAVRAAPHPFAQSGRLTAHGAQPSPAGRGSLPPVAPSAAAEAAARDDRRPALHPARRLTRDIGPIVAPVRHLTTGPIVAAQIAPAVAVLIVPVAVPIQTAAAAIPAAVQHLADHEPGQQRREERRRRGCSVGTGPGPTGPRIPTGSHSGARSHRPGSRALASAASHSVSVMSLAALHSSSDV